MRLPLPLLGLGLAAALATLDPPTARPGRPAAPRPSPEALAEPDFLPPPTEHVLDPDAETRNKAARKAWVKEKHRAAPGVDTKAIERGNGLAQVARRARLRRAPPAETPTPRWVERGSDNQAGRMHAARLNATGDVLYGGSSLGGVWKGSPEGEDWEPIGDNLYGGAHWVEVLDDGTGGDIVFVATDGGLIHSTHDGGETWEVPDGLGSPTWVRRVLKLEDGGDVLYVLSSDASGTQLRRSEDLGDSFEVIYDLGAYSGDLWAPRDGGTTLYLAGPGGQVLSSDDLGDTWTSLGTFDAASTRAELTGSEAGAPRLWVVSDGAALFRSDDAGATYTLKTRLSDYWSALNASIDDPDLFAYGGVDLYATYDGGDTFNAVNSWWEYYGDPANLLHADMMGVEVQLDAHGDEVWYVCTDGGLYRSQDGLNTVENLSLRGLRVSQYYGTLTSSANPEHIAAGAQDQGYQITNDVAQDDDLQEFSQAISGDYGHLTSSDGSHKYVYSVYPGFILVQVGEDDPWLAYLDFPSGESYVPWLPPIVADPEDAKAFFFPATRLYRYTFNQRDGTATSELWSDQSFSSDGYEYMSDLAFSPLDPNRAFASTSYGRFFYSTDKGVTWTQSPSLVPDDNWYYGQATVASKLDVDRVYVGGSGYGVPGVARSEDGGATFKPWGQGLPDALVYCLCEAPDSSGRMFAGTETSAYMRGPDDAEWTDITDTDAPITTYWSCESLVAENTIRFGTYGRGIWDYQLDPDHIGCYPVQDYDGDGADCESDCDDQDATIAPTAAESCDGTDVNCDPADLVETDADGDGYLACAECDDPRAGLYPGATEICGDGLDQDCSGADLVCDGPGDSAAGDGGGDGGDGGDKDDPGRCGCAAGPAGAGGGALLALALVAARRRRTA